MSDIILNGKVPHQAYNNDENQLEEPSAKPPETLSTLSDDWSDGTKELLDSLPQVWTRGMLYFLFCFVCIALPWATFSKVDETGTARGRLEPKGKTVKLDSAVVGTIAKIEVKEGEIVQAGQAVAVLDSSIAKVEFSQAKDKLEGQSNRLSQLNVLKNQLIMALGTQRQQNQAQELEKQAQIDQARQNFSTTRNAYELQKEEKLAQLNQARQAIQDSQTANKLAESSLSSTLREVERYSKLWKEGVVPEISVVEKKDIAKEKQKLYEQSRASIEQSKLRLAEQRSSYERNIRQAQADIEQAQLRLQEQERSYQALIHSGRLAILKSEEQLKNLETEISTLKSEIAQTNNQIKSLQLQLAQRILKSPIAGRVFQLPIQRPGSVVQSGTMIAEIAPEGSPLIIRAQMGTGESGSLKKGLAVKIKLDAYPFQDYGIIEGELIEISPTSSEVDTPNGKVAAYNLEIALKQNCIASNNKCIPLRPGDTATAEVIVRQRRIIDFLLDPFKKLQQGDLKL
jgi:hemolysin D